MITGMDRRGRVALQRRRTSHAFHTGQDEVERDGDGCMCARGGALLRPLRARIDDVAGRQQVGAHGVEGLVVVLDDQHAIAGRDDGAVGWTIGLGIACRRTAAAA